MGVPLQSVTARLTGPARELRGSVNATGKFQTRGLLREDLAQNLTGIMELRLRDISFGDFDPLASLAQQAHWGKLEPAHGSVTALPATLNVEIRDRRIVLKPMTLDLSGANLQCSGVYAWAGSLNLNVRADLRRLRRRWASRPEDAPRAARLEQVRLVGQIDHLTRAQPQGLASLGRTRDQDGVR
jgi:hypothetical protein